MLKENNALDFDDLIYKTVLLFQQNPEVLEKYQNKSIGKSLISMAENQALLCGYKCIEIGTTEHLVKYYEKLGYKYNKTIKDFFVKNYEFPVIDNGIILKNMIRLMKNL